MADVGEVADVPMLEVGRITKPHGLKGEVIVELVTNRSERAAVGTTLHTPRGPLVIARSSPHRGRWIVAFEGCCERGDAEGLRGTVLFAEPTSGGDELWVHELIGSTVTDAAGTERGTVVAVVANPASDLLELDTGQLVPLRFVTGNELGRVRVDVPAGLFDVG